jgi:hypothetical protein
MKDSSLVEQAVAGKRAGPSGWVRAHCPFCAMRGNSPDRRASLGLNTATGDWHCFRCGARGWCRGEYARDESAAAPDAREPLAPPEHFTPLFSGPGASADSLAGARAYVTGKRRVPEGVARELGIGACLGGRFGGRVVVPVTDAAGAWRWYVARAWGPSEKPYLYPLGSRGAVMFNERALDVETDEPVCVMEGCFDAISDWPHSVAVLGKPTQDHVKRIARSRRPVCIMLDGDVPDDSFALSLLLKIEECEQRVGIAQLGPCVDPDELAPGEVRRLAREACAKK